MNDEIGDLEDRLAALKDKADSLGKKYMTAKKESEKADKEFQVNFINCAVILSISLSEPYRCHMYKGFSMARLSFYNLCTHFLLASVYAFCSLLSHHLLDVLYGLKLMPYCCMLLLLAHVTAGSPEM